MVRINPTSVLGGFERLLLLMGVLLVGIFVALQSYTALYSRFAIGEFDRKQAAVTTARMNSLIRPASEFPDFRFWSVKRIEAYQTSSGLSDSSPLGVLEIPSINLDVPVLEGTDDLTLNRGVGHIAGTPAPGETGNVGIAGHRDGFFRGLKDVHPGDTIDLRTLTGNVRYTVDEIVIVPPQDISVLEAKAKPSLTLVTCYPFYFVGSAPLRYVVHASIVNADDLQKSHLPALHSRNGQIEKRK